MSNRPRKPSTSMRAAAARDAQVEAQAAAAKARRRSNAIGVAACLVLAGIVGAIAFFALRGGDDEAAIPEPPREVVANGCLSCHTRDGARSEGPT